MLFLSGTREKMVPFAFLLPLCRKLGKGTDLHLLDTKDPGFKVLKRSLKSEEDVFVEMARVAAAWVNEFESGQC